MNGLETAIKSALARADRTNAEIRARIYQSARQALETGLRKQNISDPEFLTEQRHRLEVLIHAIEQQERAAIAAAEEAAAAFSLDASPADLPAAAAEPQPDQRRYPPAPAAIARERVAPEIAPETSPQPAPGIAPQIPPQTVTSAAARREADAAPRFDDLRAERPGSAPAGRLPAADSEGFGAMRAERDDRVLGSARSRTGRPETAPSAEPLPAGEDIVDGFAAAGPIEPVVEPQRSAAELPGRAAGGRRGRASEPAPSGARARAEDDDGAPHGGPALDIRADAPLREKRRSRGLLSRLFILATLLAALGLGAWWVYSLGLLKTASERDTGLPPPTPRVEQEDFTGTPPKAAALDPQQGFSDAWLAVFEPKRIAELRTHRNAQVEPIAASDGSAVRITSKSGDDEGNVEIPVPVSVMREMVGKTSTIALTMQSPSDKPLQVSVTCDFNLLGTCPRHRVTVNPEKSDVLIRVSFDRAMAPAKPGILSVNGDLTGHGQPVRLYAVRVLPGQ